jgi:signal transduction histidine kinase
VLYARLEGQPSSSDELGPALQMLVERAGGDSEHGVVPAKAFIRHASTIYEVAVSPILPEEDTQPPVSAAGANRLVLARRIDARLLLSLANSYAIDDPVVAESPLPSREMLPLPGPDGTAVGYLAWRASRPGRILRRWTAPALLAALGVFGLFAWLTLHNLRRTAALWAAHEAAIRRSAERERLEKAQHAFVATVSHELRTPLTAIDGSLALVDSGAVGTLPDGG